MSARVPTGGWESSTVQAYTSLLVSLLVPFPPYSAVWTELTGFQRDVGTLLKLGLFRDSPGGVESRIKLLLQHVVPPYMVMGPRLEAIKIVLMNMAERVRFELTGLLHPSP